MTAASTTGSLDEAPQGNSIVGRSREQALLRSLLDRALTGQGNLVLSLGGAGIGKTSLVQWLADEARQQDVRILEGNCYDLTVTSPYGPWLDAVANVGAEHPLRAVFDTETVTSQSLLFDRAHEFLGDVTAYGNRGAQFNLSLDNSWEDPADNERMIAWTQDNWSSLRNRTGGGVYLNFAGLGEDNALLARAGYATNYDRLRNQAPYDPTNFFRTNINITP